MCLAYGISLPFTGFRSLKDRRWLCRNDRPCHLVASHHLAWGSLVGQGPTVPSIHAKALQRPFIGWGAPAFSRVHRATALEPATGHRTKDGKGCCLRATVRIGVTGHRRLNDEGTLRQSVRGVLARLDGILSHTPHAFVVVSPLAEGADRLVVQEVLAWPETEEAGRHRLEAVLPLPPANYVQDFGTEESRDEFQSLLTGAASVHLLGTAASRTAAYQQAGRHVVQSCDVLVAIWDGNPARGKGGSAEIVTYARQAGRSLFWIHAGSGEVVEERRSDHTLESLEQLDAENGERLRQVA